MDRKSKILLLFFIIALLVSITATYHRTLIRQDFYIEESEPEEEIIETQEELELDSE